MSFRRSTLNDSAMVTTSGYPFWAHTMARPMPVLPLVASTTVWPGLSGPSTFGVLDDAEGEAILHRSERVERLDLDVEVDARGSELGDFDDGGIADRLEDVREFSQWCHRSKRWARVSGGAPGSQKMQPTGAVVEGTA